MANFYPPDQYDPDGHLFPDALSHPMDPTEQQTYWLSCLPIQPPLPEVLFTAPL